MFIHLKKEHFSSPERMQLRNLFPWSGPKASTVWAAGCRPQKQTKPSSSCLTDASFSPGWLRGLLVSKGSCLYSARVNLGSSRLKLLWWLTFDSSKLVLWLNKNATSKLFNLLLLNSSREMDLLPWPGKMLVVSWSWNIFSEDTEAKKLVSFTVEMEELSTNLLLQVWAEEIEETDIVWTAELEL